MHRRWSLGLTLAVLAVGAIVSASGCRSRRDAQAPFTVGLDHVNVAVRDLDAAATHYSAMGFALKPGRPHLNGITNRHIKFTNGTELELITAPAPADDLTRYYRRLIDAGDGAGFLALHPSDCRRGDRAPVTRRFAGQTFGLHLRLSVRPSPRPRRSSRGSTTRPTDRPEHFAHANTAVRLPPSGWPQRRSRRRSAPSKRLA